jgi:hypothetical protein
MRRWLVVGFFCSTMGAQASAMAQTVEETRIGMQQQAQGHTASPAPPAVSFAPGEWEERARKARSRRSYGIVLTALGAIALGFGLSMIDYGVTSKADIRDGIKLEGELLTGLAGIPFAAGGTYLWVTGQRSLWQLEDARAANTSGLQVPARMVSFGWTFYF